MNEPQSFSSYNYVLWNVIANKLKHILRVFVRIVSSGGIKCIKNIA